MSVQATTWVWEHSASRKGTRLVALAIADAANREGGESCQSIQTIIRMTGLAESTVHEAIKWLLEHGELAYVGDNPRYKNARIYRFPHMQRGVQIPDPPEPGGSEQLALGVQITGERGAVDRTRPQEEEPKKKNPLSPGGTGETITLAPGNFVIDAPMARWWAGKNRPDINLDAETERFLDWHRVNGKKRKDWVKAWKNWMLRAADRQPSRLGQNGQPLTREQRMYQEGWR